MSICAYQGLCGQVLVVGLSEIKLDGVGIKASSWAGTFHYRYVDVRRLESSGGGGRVEKVADRRRPYQRFTRLIFFSSSALLSASRLPALLKKSLALLFVLREFYSGNLFTGGLGDSTLGSREAE